MKRQIEPRIHLWDKGFTIVEIMIVIVIIGILVAIALPGFLSYKTRGFNSSALSDTKNIVSAQSLMQASTQSFGVSSGPIPIVANTPVYPGSGGGIGALIDNSLTAGNNTIGLTWTDANLNNVGVTIGLGQGVSAIVSMEVPPGPGVNSSSSYTIVSKHVDGNRYYGKDSDSESIYVDQFISGGSALVVADAVGSTFGNDDFNAPAVGPSGNNWFQL